MNAVDNLIDTGLDTTAGRITCSLTSEDPDYNFQGKTVQIMQNIHVHIPICIHITLTYIRIHTHTFTYTHISITHTHIHILNIHTLTHIHKYIYRLIHTP